MRQSALIGYPVGGGESVCLDCGNGPRIEAEFKAIRSGESKPEGMQKVELWSRLKGKLKQHTFKSEPVSAVSQSEVAPDTESPALSEGDEKAEIRAKLKELGIKAGPRAGVETLRNQLEEAQSK